MNPTDKATLVSDLVSDELTTPSAKLSDEPGSKGSRVLGKVLSSAIELWLRTQVEAIIGLRFRIQGSDGEILRGRVPQVSVQAGQVVYQELYLSQVDLTASQIQINLRQVLQGKPLRLLEVVPVVGSVRLSQADLDASMNAPLLKQALADFLALVLKHLQQEFSDEQIADLAALQPFQIVHPQIRLDADRLTLTTDLLAPNQQQQFMLHTQLRLLHGSQLQLSSIAVHYTSPAQQTNTATPTQPLVIDLGSEVQLQKLEITKAEILCQGRINVMSGS